MVSSSPRNESLHHHQSRHPELSSNLLPGLGAGQEHKSLSCSIAAKVHLAHLIPGNSREERLSILHSVAAQLALPYLQKTATSELLLT